MSNLAKIFQRHDGSEHFNSKVLQTAARYSSRTMAYNLIANGSEHYEKFRELLRRLPTPVSHDILNDLTQETPFAIAPRGDASGEPPMTQCLSVMRRWAEYTEQFLEALKDGRVDEAEDAKLEPMLAEIERAVASIRQAKNARRKFRIA